MLEQLEAWLMAARYTRAGLRWLQGDQHTLGQGRQAYEHSCTIPSIDRSSQVMQEQLEAWLMAARYSGAGLRWIQGDQHTLAQDRQAREQS